MGRMENVEDQPFSFERDSDFYFAPPPPRPVASHFRHRAVGVSRNRAARSPRNGALPQVKRMQARAMKRCREGQVYKAIQAMLAGVLLLDGYGLGTKKVHQKRHAMHPVEVYKEDGAAFRHAMRCARTLEAMNVQDIFFVNLSNEAKAVAAIRAHVVSAVQPACGRRVVVTALSALRESRNLGQTT